MNWKWKALTLFRFQCLQLYEPLSVPHILTCMRYMLVFIYLYLCATGFNGSDRRIDVDASGGMHVFESSLDCWPKRRRSNIKNIFFIVYKLRTIYGFLLHMVKVCLAILTSFHMLNSFVTFCLPRETVKVYYRSYLTAFSLHYDWEWLCTYCARVCVVERDCT
jgi:hypothetical protein